MRFSIHSRPTRTSPPAVAPERGQLGPAAVEVGELQAPEEGSAAAAGSVGNGVGFQPSGLVEGLGAAADGDEFFNPVAGAAGFATDAAAAGSAVRGCDTIQGAWAVAEDFGARGLIDDPVAGLIAVDPERQGLLEANAAGLLAVLPEGDDDSLLGWAVGRLGTAP